jgi:hypothetical protein
MKRLVKASRKLKGLIALAIHIKRYKRQLDSTLQLEESREEVTALPEKSSYD